MFGNDPQPADWMTVERHDHEPHVSQSGLQQTRFANVVDSHVHGQFGGQTTAQTRPVGAVTMRHGDNVHEILMFTCRPLDIAPTTTLDARHLLHH